MNQKNPSMFWMNPHINCNKFHMNPNYSCNMFSMSQMRRQLKKGIWIQRLLRFQLQQMAKKLSAYFGRDEWESCTSFKWMCFCTSFNQRSNHGLIFMSEIWMPWIWNYFWRVLTMFERVLAMFQTNFPSFGGSYTLGFGGCYPCFKHSWQYFNSS